MLLIFWKADLVMLFFNLLLDIYSMLVFFLVQICSFFCEQKRVVSILLFVLFFLLFFWRSTGV